MRFSKRGYPGPVGNLVFGPGFRGHLGVHDEIMGVSLADHESCQTNLQNN